jgi:hypothetical protein
MEARTIQSTELVLHLEIIIEQNNGVKLNFASGTTIPMEKWIPCRNRNVSVRRHRHNGVTA